MSIANEEAAMLLRIARQDALAFVTLIANPDIEARIACFHGQQAVEKCRRAEKRSAFRRMNGPNMWRITPTADPPCGPMSRHQEA
jgi:hypothetical protein